MAGEALFQFSALSFPHSRLSVSTVLPCARIRRCSDGGRVPQPAGQHRQCAAITQRRCRRRGRGTRLGRTQTLTQQPQHTPASGQRVQCRQRRCISSSCTTSSRRSCDCHYRCSVASRSTGEQRGRRCPSRGSESACCSESWPRIAQRQGCCCGGCGSAHVAAVERPRDDGSRRRRRSTCGCCCGYCCNVNNHRRVDVTRATACDATAAAGHSAAAAWRQGPRHGVVGVPGVPLGVRAGPVAQLHTARAAPTDGVVVQEVVGTSVTRGLCASPAVLRAEDGSGVTHCEFRHWKHACYSNSPHCTRAAQCRGIACKLVVVVGTHVHDMRSETRTRCRLSQYCLLSASLCCTSDWRRLCGTARTYLQRCSSRTRYPGGCGERCDLLMLHGALLSLCSPRFEGLAEKNCPLFRFRTIACGRRNVVNFGAPLLCTHGSLPS